jgi:hypothetical protein
MMGLDNKTANIAMYGAHARVMSMPGRIGEQEMRMIAREEAQKAAGRPLVWIAGTGQ